MSKPKCDDAGVTVAGQFIPHNSRAWETRRNRHTTTAGHDWGWIEGCPGNVTWSNDCGEWSRESASLACKLHNDWLTCQQPLSVRIVDARLAVAASQKRLTRDADAMNASHRKLRKDLSELTRLEQLRAAGHATEPFSMLETRKQ